MGPWENHVNYVKVHHILQSTEWVQIVRNLQHALSLYTELVIEVL